MYNVNLGMVYEAMFGGKTECGDIGIIKRYENHAFLALVDVLGHGLEARKVALNAKEYLENNYFNSLTEIMLGLHDHLRGTRGAVAAICNMNVLTGELKYVGIGNITLRIIGRKNIRLVSRDGIVGYRMTKPQEQILKLNIGETFLMYSDGIKEHFESFECEDLLKKNAEEIAEGILHKFSKMNDDSSCIVLKYVSD